MWGWRAARHSFKARFLLAFALPLFAMYFWLALKRAGEANWTAPATLSLGVLAVALWHERAQVSVAARRFCCAALALGMAMSLVTMTPDVIRGLGIAFGGKALIQRVISPGSKTVVITLLFAISGTRPNVAAPTPGR